MIQNSQQELRASKNLTIIRTNNNNNIEIQRPNRSAILPPIHSFRIVCVSTLILRTSLTTVRLASASKPRSLQENGACAHSLSSPHSPLSFVAFSAVILTTWVAKPLVCRLTSAYLCYLLVKYSPVSLSKHPP